VHRRRSFSYAGPRGCPLVHSICAFVSSLSTPTRRMLAKARIRSSRLGVYVTSRSLIRDTFTVLAVRPDTSTSDRSTTACLRRPSGSEDNLGLSNKWGFLSRRLAIAVTNIISCTALAFKPAWLVRPTMSPTSYTASKLASASTLHPVLGKIPDMEVPQQCCPWQLSLHRDKPFTLAYASLPSNPHSSSFPRPHPPHCSHAPADTCTP